MDEEVSLNHIKILVQYAQHAPQEHWEEWIQQTEKRKHFFDLIGDNIPQILHSPFNIIPDLAQFFIEEVTSPKIKTDAEVMEGVQKQLEKELEEGTGSVYPTPSPRCPPKVSAFVSAFD